jgi:hypothetical protein
VPYDEYVLRGAHDLGRFGENQFHDTRVLAGLGSELPGTVRHEHVGEVSEATLGLGDDLLRNHEHIVRLRFQARRSQGSGDDGAQVAAGPDFVDVTQGMQANVGH